MVSFALVRPTWSTVETRAVKQRDAADRRLAQRAHEDAVALHGRAIEGAVAQRVEERRAGDKIGRPRRDGDLLLVDFEPDRGLYLSPCTSGPSAAKVDAVVDDRLVDVGVGEHRSRRKREGEAIGEGDRRVGRGARGIEEVDERGRGGLHDVRTERNLRLSNVQRFSMNCSKSGHRRRESGIRRHRRTTRRSATPLVGAVVKTRRWA